MTTKPEPQESGEGVATRPLPPAFAEAFWLVFDELRRGGFTKDDAVPLPLALDVTARIAARLASGRADADKAGGAGE